MKAARAGERGSVLLAVLLMTAVAVAMSAALLDSASALVAELRARREVLCARYAALGGLALATPTGSAAALVGPQVDALGVSLVRSSATWCVCSATATCGEATRSFEHTLADATSCP